METNTFALMQEPGSLVDDRLTAVVYACPNRDVLCDYNGGQSCLNEDPCLTLLATKFW